ncbi:MAG: hypothetical protein U0R72_08425 [Nakamurella multipartita]
MGERAGPIGLLDALADLVLPRPCPGCGRAGPWCADCARTVSRVPRRIRPPDDPAAAAGLPPAWALAHYTGPVRAAVLAGKEKGRRDLPPRLGRDLGSGVLHLLAWGAVLEPVWLVPAPSRLSAARRRGVTRSGRWPPPPPGRSPRRPGLRGRPLPGDRRLGPGTRWAWTWTPGAATCPAGSACARAARRHPVPTCCCSTTC